MITKNRFGDIDPSDIFANDRLGRKDAIENLSSLIASTKESLVMSINADWGAGKTTLVKLWQAHLEKEKGVKSIYFSAWEDDFSKEPLISILGEINKYISSNFEDTSPTVENFKKVKEFGGKVLRRGLPALIKGATSGILDVEKGIEEAVGAISEQTTKELIEQYSKNKEITEKFKESIHKVLENIDQDKPFVVFIDELDRCRPLYAIELLERIKHIFGIDGLIFVLSIDKKQLAESIKSQYGNIDAHGYLRRFIDLEYSLQNPSIDKFCDYLYTDVYGLDKVIRGKEIRDVRSVNEVTLKMLKYLANSMRLSLREVEHIFIQINIVFKTIEKNLPPQHFRVFIFFAALKLKYPQLYVDLIGKKVAHDHILSLVLSIEEGSKENENIRALIKSILIATSKTDEEIKEAIRREKEVLVGIENSNPRYYEQSRLVTFLNIGQDGYYCLNELIDVVIKKIEFVEKFSFDGLENV
jgi:hypothetical protein